LELVGLVFLTNPPHEIKTMQAHSTNHVNPLHSSYKCIREIKTKAFPLNSALSFQ